MPMKDLIEIQKHADCKECGAKTIPAKGVADQSLRGCVVCGCVFDEVLNERRLMTWIELKSVPVLW